MSLPPKELEEIAEVLNTVRPYLDDLVLIGGWAHRLFRLHPLSRPRSFESLTTEDVDFAVPDEINRPNAELLSALLEGAEFKPVHKSIHTVPPVTRYEGKTGLLVEFVANLEGASHDKQGQSKDVIEVAGVTAELLRYVYPLQVCTWSPGQHPDHPVLSRVRIASPVSYLFQKILVSRRRRRGKDANDVIYIADTADLFGDQLDGLGEEWTNSIGPQIHPKHLKKFRAIAEALSAPGDVHLVASKIAESIGRPRSAEILAETIRLVVSRVFPKGPFET